ncbi:MAG TPA: YkvA family protein [Thermomonospora sp.]|nr:YkvA family protein [Thermomonospora sp.]
MNAKRRAAAAGQAWRIYGETTRPGAPGLWTRARAVPAMVRDTLRGDYQGLGYGRLALLAFALVYLLSPLDAIPEFLPFIGVADDLGVALWVLATLVSAAGDYVTTHRRHHDVLQGEVVT